MLQLNHNTKIWLAVQPVDFRLGIDGLKILCQTKLSADPTSGVVFVFRNKKRTAIKLLCHDGQGFWLCHKRWSAGYIQWWPKNGQTIPMMGRALQVLLWNGDPQSAQMSGDWHQAAANVLE